MGLPANSRAGPSDSAALPLFRVQVLLFILIVAPGAVGVDGDAPPAPEAKLSAHANIFGRVDRTRHRNLDDCENVIVFWKGRGIFSRGKRSSGVRHVLEPRAVFRIDHAELLHRRRDGGASPRDEEAAVAWVVPD